MVHCSPQRRRLCAILIKEFFGETVEVPVACHSPRSLTLDWTARTSQHLP